MNEFSLYDALVLCLKVKETLVSFFLPCSLCLMLWPGSKWKMAAWMTFLLERGSFPLPQDEL